MEVSVWAPPLPTRVGCLHLPANCHPPTQRAWWLQPRLIRVLLLPRQSRQSAPRNTPRFPWRARSRCSATWQVPTAPSMRASGWRTERRSRKHAPKIKTPSTGVCVCVRFFFILFYGFIWGVLPAFIWNVCVWLALLHAWTQFQRSKPGNITLKTQLVCGLITCHCHVATNAAWDEV